MTGSVRARRARPGRGRFASAAAAGAANGAIAAGAPSADAPAATRPRSEVTLPAQYGAAIELADAMLAAANAGDWPAVDALRRTLPGLARALDRRWAELRAIDPSAGRRLEAARIEAIRRVLTVDDRIRQLSDGSRGTVDAWLRGAAATRTLN